MRLLSTFILFSGALFAQPEWLPLKEGNTWTYQERRGTTSFTIRVGSQAFIGNEIYHRLTGYTPQPVWVRYHDDGDLYYRNEEFERDELLISFEPLENAYWNVPLRECEQGGQTQTKREAVNGPAGAFPSALAIKYLTFGCADVGLLEEKYAANIGLIERIEQSIAGPRVYELTLARVGSLTLRSGAWGSFTVSVQRPFGAAGLRAALELRVSGPEAVNLRFTTSQDFDVIVRTQDGRPVWRWSDGQFFLQVLRAETTLGKQWDVEIPQLPAGKYEVEAWVLSGPGQRDFAAVAPIEIPEVTIQ
jgi:hypothetical protein